MPIYEYEHEDPPGPMCEARFEALQSPQDPPLEYCPTCGLPAHRVVSRAAFKLNRAPTADQAAKKGFSTFRKAGGGVWEKIAGEGPDLLSKDSEPPAS